MKNSTNDLADISVSFISNIYVPENYDFILNLMSNYTIDIESMEIPKGLTNQEEQPAEKQKLLK